jgi:hypothetical protein
METVFDSDELPVSERTEAWVAATTASLVPNRFTFPDRTTFGARLQAMPSGAAQLCAPSYAAQVRTPTPSHRSG